MNPVAQIGYVGHYSTESQCKYVAVFCPGCEMRHHFEVEVPADWPLRPDGTQQPKWEWDGNLEQPTFSPSMLAYSSVHKCQGLHEVTVCTDDDCPERSHSIAYMIDGEPKILKVWEAEGHGYEEVPAHVGGHPEPYDNTTAWGNCHSFLKAGRWEFLGDSAHALAGQTVDMVPLPDWMIKNG